jgi:hypothetical protein
MTHDTISNPSDTAPKRRTMPRIDELVKPNRARNLSKCRLNVEPKVWSLCLLDHRTLKPD